jgi:hypothetical protein
MGSFSTRGDCNGALYADLFAGVGSGKAGGAGQLAQLCIREKVDALTATATLHVTAQGDVDSALQLLGALDTDERASRAALLALAGFAEWGPRRPDDSPGLNPDPLLERIPKWWKAHPARRAALLLLLTQIGERYSGKIAWPKLADYLGAPIGADELASFLELGPRSLAALPNFSAAVGNGWTRSAVVIPKLQAWLSAYSNSGRKGLSPHFVTERVFEFSCNAGTAADITELHAFVRNRVDTFPEERDQLGTLAEKSPAELCPKFNYGPPGKPVLFGD